MKRYSLYLCGLLALWACYSPPDAQALCSVSSATPTFVDGSTMQAESCDTSGNMRVTIGGSAAGGLGTANAAAPTLVEAAAASFSFDLSGNVRMTMGTLLSGEDQTNNLIMTSGGAVRTTTFSSVTAAATNSTVTTVPVGSKTFFVQIINATSETKAATVSIYGNVISSTTGGILLCTVTLPSTATTLQLQDACPVVTANFPYYYYATAAGAAGYTSASSAPVTVYASY